VRKPNHKIVSNGNLIDQIFLYKSILVDDLNG
jgi:hypothetical protein